MEDEKVQLVRNNQGKLLLDAEICEKQLCQKIKKNETI